MTPKRSVIGEVPWALVGIVISVALLGVYIYTQRHTRRTQTFSQAAYVVGYRIGACSRNGIRTIEQLSQSLTSHS